MTSFRGLLDQPVAERTDEALERRERRAQLVRDRRHEVALQLLGLQLGGHVSRDDHEGLRSALARRHRVARVADPPLRPVGPGEEDVVGARFIEAQRNEGAPVRSIILEVEREDLVAPATGGTGSRDAGDVLHRRVPGNDQAVRGHHEDPIRGVADHVGQVAPLFHRLVEQTLVLVADLQL